MARPVQRCPAQQHHPGIGERAQLRLGAGLEHGQVIARQGLAVERHVAFHGVQRALGMFGGNGQSAAGLQVDRNVQRVRQHGHRRALAEGVAGDDGHADARQFDHRQRGGRVVHEGRRGVFVFARQRHPGLQAVHALRLAQQALGRAFGVGDAAAGGHPVHVARVDFLQRAQAVAVHDRALPQVGHRGQANVRMRPHFQRMVRVQRGRADVVEEYEGAHAAGLGVRQQALDGEAAAQVVHARGDRQGHRGLRVERKTSMPRRARGWPQRWVALSRWKRRPAPCRPRRAR